MAQTKQPEFFVARYVQGGKVEKQQFYMPDRQAVRRALRERGASVLSIRQKRLSWWQRELISNNYKLQFMRSVAFHVRTGSSGARALMLIIEREEKDAIRFELETARDALRRGQSVSDAFASLGFFDPVIIGMIRAGERSGTLPEALDAASKYISNRSAQTKKFWASISFFVFDILMAISSVVGVQYQFLPWIEEQIQEIEDATKRAEVLDYLNTAYIANGAMMWLALLVTGTIIGFVTYLKLRRQSDSGWLGKVLPKLPVVRTLLYDGELSIGFALIAKMIKSGIELPKVIALSAHAASLGLVKESWKSVEHRLMHGQSVARALQVPILTTYEKLAVKEHQDAEQLGELFAAFAKDREERAERGRKMAMSGMLVITIMYSFISACIAIYALWLQNQAGSAVVGSMTQF
jgi:general secretion pathway protein F